VRVDRNPTFSLGNRSFLLFVRKNPARRLGFSFPRFKMHAESCNCNLFDPPLLPAFPFHRVEPGAATQGKMMSPSTS
jgi:hypothetical protein